MLPSSFSRQCELRSFSTKVRYTSQLILDGSRTSLTPGLVACPHSTSGGVCSSSCVPASVKRISVVQEFPPVVHRLRLYVLGLGPDLPWADEPSPGNLRLSTDKILTYLSLLIPAFSLVYSPRRLTLTLLPVYDAPLPLFRVHSFGGTL
jgi:hypothetical protein